LETFTGASFSFGLALEGALGAGREEQPAAAPAARSPARFSKSRRFMAPDLYHAALEIRQNGRIEPSAAPRLESGP
jgi:hypothetical protein